MSKLPKFQKLGMTLVMRFNEREIVTEDDGVRYEYDVAKVCKTSSRVERIEAIIKTRYPTYGAELAAIHKEGVEHDEYLTFRELAKQIASESFENETI